MKRFFRENPTIAFGLGLPLLLVLVFLLISGIPSILVEPPQHDVIYATEYFNYPNGVQIAVFNQNIQITYLGSTPGYQKPRLWRYNSNTGSVKEIVYMLPTGLAQAGQVGTPNVVATATPISVPELAGQIIDSSSISPDGYEFNAGFNSYSGDIFTGLFYSPRYRSEAVLSKKGRSIRLPNANNLYNSTNTHFIGWVVTP
jgi:hypothetical protein